jgi:hypothetical protein
MVAILCPLRFSEAISVQFTGDRRALQQLSSIPRLEMIVYILVCDISELDSLVTLKKAD